MYRGPEVAPTGVGEPRQWGSDQKPEPSTHSGHAGVVPVQGRARAGCIYVGKAKSLRSRVMSYFGTGLMERTRQMVATADTVEWIGVRNEVEALFLEFNLIQQAPAPLQHPVQGRQVLPVPRGHARRGMAAGDGDAGREAQGGPVLRAVRPRLRDPGDPRPAPADVPDPHLHQGQVRPLPAARSPVPLRPHREVRGAVRGCGHATRSTTASSTSCSSSSTATPPRSSTGSTSTCTRRATRSSSSARRASATRSSRSRKAIERQQMVDAKEEDYDAIGIVEDELEASVQVFLVRKGRVVGRKALVVDKVEDLTQARARRPPARAALRRRRSRRHPARGPRSGRSPTTSRSTRSSSPRRAGAQVRPAGARSAAPSGSCSQTVTQNARGGVRAPQAPARVRPQRAGARTLLALQEALAAARSPAAHRVLRRLEPPGHRDRRVDGGDGGRPAQALRLPALQDAPSDGQDDFAAMEEALDPPLPALPRRARRRCARRASGSRTRRTCCWSTAARVSSASRCACSRTSGSRTSAWPAWPSASRRSTCPATRSRCASRATPRRCTCSSRSATRRTASRSRTTVSCATRR